MDFFGCVMPRNPGNRHREIKIYPDANSKFVRMEFTDNKKINLYENALVLLQKRFSPSPKRRKIKYVFAFILVVFLQFSKISEPQVETLKSVHKTDVVFYMKNLTRRR